MADIQALRQKCMAIRRDVIEMVHLAGSGHPGGSLSAVELMVALYYHKMRIDPRNPKWEDRDRFVLSKGHASPALYAVLADLGYFDRSELWKLRKADGILQGAPGYKTPGIDMSSGSLGQGMSVATGMALAARMQGKSFKTFVMMGDGEMQEGIVWEALMAAAHYRLGNLVAILDDNHVQMCGKTCEILSMGSFRKKLEAFDWRVIEVDGHDLEAIVAVLDGLPDAADAQPVFIRADTVKGKGVSFMEGTAAWHGGAPDAAQYATALAELGGKQ
jgi:transketolase